MPTTFRPRPVRALAPLTAAAALLLSGGAHAQAGPRVAYEIAFPNAVHHEAEVSATFTGVPTARPLQVRMSRSSPGRYALHEFAKNVYRVRAVDGHGRALAVTRPDPYGWTVAPGDGTVRFTYTLFGDRTDGTYAGIDPTHAHLNMPATFAFARGLEGAPIRVAFRRPVAAWSIATQLMPTADAEVFTAPNLQYFMDSPTEVGPISWRTWHETAGGRDVTVRIAMHHVGTDAELDAFTAQVKRIVAEEAALYGGMPSDRGVYTFIVDYLPWADGDGMEHRNSTIVTSSRSLAAGAKRNLQTMAHEFFHQWNVERIRPRSLEPFDFERANMSGELWFAEGFTNYFHGVMLRRAGVFATDAEWAAGASGAVSTVLTAPGRNFFSAADMARQAPFVDAAQSIDPQNRQNTFISYYTYGEALGLGLDLTLRERYGKSLDDYMRAMWAQYGTHQSAALAPERPYTLADLRRVLGEVSGDTAFARDFFRRHVEGLEPLDYAALLAPAGFALRPAHPGRAWFGAAVDDADDGAEVTTAQIGSPAYASGIDRGDVILAVGGRAVANADSALASFAAHRPGDEVAVQLRSRTGPRTVTVRFGQDPALAIVPVETLGQPLTDAMRALRQAWLAPKAGR
ncbi:MAG: family metallopeptidase [Gemmatimonadetes bacterium]|nr:family metallopeptidase [Gemmatimonadota bacterium]